MEITLEKIELVKEKTGVSYKDAKIALEKVDGSVVDAIINIESGNNFEEQQELKAKGAAVIGALKEIVKKGNASKIRITNEDGDVILSVPVSVGLVGAFITPWGLILATLVAFGLKCNIEVVKVDGTIVDVSGTARDSVNVAKEKGYDTADNVKTKGKEVVEKVKETTIYEKVLNSDTYDKIKEKTDDFMGKGKKEMEEFAEDFMAEVDEEEELVDESEQIKE